MAKSVQVINDFRGGIAKGVNPKNLKDNQLKECVNFVIDGVGKLSTVPGESYASTSSINRNLPDGAGRNIHAWSSDMELSVSGQVSNMGVPTVEEEFKPMTFKVTFYASEISDSGKTIPRVLGMDINGERAMQNVFVPYLTDLHHTENSLPKKLILDHSGSTFTYTGSAVSDAQNRVVAMLDSFVYNSTLDNASGANIYEMKWEEATGTGGNTHKVASQHYFANNSNKFYIKRLQNQTEDWGPSSGTANDIYSITGYLEYKGDADMSLNGNLVEPNAYLRNLTNSTVFRITGSDGNPDNINASTSGGDSIWMPSHQFDSSTTNFSVANGFLYIKPLYYLTDGYGSYSYWKYNLLNVSATETATYSVVIRVFTNFAQSAHTDYTFTYHNNLGDNHLDVLNGLLNNDVLDATIPEDYKIISEDTDTGKRLKQGSFTKKAYGFTVTQSKGSITQHPYGSIGAGQKFQHLIAVGGVQSQAQVYSLQNDNWLDYPIDLRDTGATSGNDVKFSFLDAEGYLRASDSTFLDSNKPKWFGYMNVDKTYENTTHVEPTGFFVEDCAPTPHGDNANVVGNNVLANQWTHIADKSNVMYVYQAVGDSDIDVTVPHVNTTAKYMPHPQGLKLWYDWIDNQDGEAGALMSGMWLAKETVEFYWSYIYEGGAISQPRIFRTYHANSDTGGNLPMSTNPGADNCSLGLHLSVGRQLTSGSGTTMYNARLKGIEIWGRFVNTDANNLYQMLEVDLNKGWRSFATGDWKDLHAISKSGNVEQYNMLLNGANQAISACPIYTSPPTFLSFYNKYEISWDKAIGFESPGTGFKTGCVFNRRAYYGNVRIKGQDGQLKRFPDGILRSSKGMYDTFSIDSLVEATVNDGDEIVCLRVVGNKLCQFKKYSLAIMGIKVLENGQTTERIEKIIHHVGVNNDNQVADTPYGLYWISRSGIYVFNGETVEKITETAEGSIISKQDWESFYGERSHCGYDAYWNQIHICKDTKNNDRTIIYDFNTRAFTEGHGLYNTPQKTGFVNDRHGHLLWAEVPASTPSSNLGNTGSSPSSQNNTVMTSIPQQSSE